MKWGNAFAGFFSGSKKLSTQNSTKKNPPAKMGGVENRHG